MYTYTLVVEVVTMFNIMFLLAALVFALGVLIGSVLQTQAVDRRYRRVALRVRELHELEEVLAEQDETLTRSDHSRASYQRHSPSASPMAVGRSRVSAEKR
jgi:hypothetical protein